MKKIDQLISEYKSDPNCYPELWISGENLTDIEKSYFINQLTNLNTL